MSHLALVFVVLGISWLFHLERDRKNRPSKALLLPLIWLLIAGSRSVGEWVQMGSPSGESNNYLEGNPVDRDVMSVLIAIGILIVIQRRKKIGALLRANGPLLMYFGYCLLSIVWSEFPVVGLKRWIRAAADVVVILIVLTDRDWLLARKRLYAWSGFILLPASVLLIRYFPDIGRSYGEADGQMYWTGVTDNKNELGMICMIFGLASLARLLDIYRNGNRSRKRGEIVAHSVVVATSIWLLHVADSATSLACFLIGATLLVLSGWRPVVRKTALLHLLVLGMLGIGVSSLFLGVGTGLVHNLGRNSTLTGRTAMWGHALSLVTDPIFGTGYENFWVGPRLDAMRPFAGGVNQAHNAYLEVYLNLGWVGVVFVGFLIITGYKKVIAAFRRDPDSARLGLVYFVVTLPYGFTEAGAFKFANPVWISFLMAIIGASLIKSKRIQNSEGPVSAKDVNERSELSKDLVCGGYA